MASEYGPRGTVLGSILSLALSLAFGCESDAGSSSAPPETETLVSCHSDADCSGERCVMWPLERGAPLLGFPGVCEYPCEVDADCPVSAALAKPVCASIGGAKQCMSSCSNDAPRYYECDRTRPVSCVELDDTHCAACGCDEGMLCTPTGCTPLRNEGEACTSHEQCRSKNCSDKVGVCRVAMGAPCTEDNCDFCLRSNPNDSRQPADWSYCSRGCKGGRACDEKTSCPMGFESDPDWACMPLCSRQVDPASCPHACEALPDPVNNRIYQYCRCFGCQNTIAPR